MYKQPHAGPASFSRMLPKLFDGIAGIMHTEGKQVKGHKHRRQGLVPMAKIVLKVITVIFQYVERLIFNLPASSRT